MQGFDTSVMKQTIGDLGNIQSVLKGIDVTGVKLATENLTRLMPAQDRTIKDLESENDVDRAKS
ncbi:hypothetical protein LAC02_33600 [Ligilactobacillus acidipiscis]|nr:hypothetical protein LAC02_33600 [Ligilactobacillus acidipiscis]